MKKFIGLLSILLGLLSTVHAQDLPLDPKCKYGVLGNGLTYYIYSHDNPKGKANFYIATKVGSAQETDKEHGLAHYAEHMAFNGSKNFPKGAMMNYMQSYGLGIGANLNAYTSYYKTVYNINQIPVDNQNLMDSCLLILHDWSSYVSFDQDELDAERGVITEEYRTRMADMTHSLGVLQNNFPGSIYAKRTIIGDLNVIQNHTRDQIVNLYNKWYRPDLQAIIIVGDFDADNMEKRVKNLFNKIPARTGPERLIYPIPENKEPLIHIATSSEYDAVKFDYAFKRYVDEGESHYEKEKRSSCHAILFKILDDRFNELEKEYSDIIQAFHIQRIKDLKSIELYGLGALVKNNCIKEAFELVVIEARRLNKYGVSQNEFDKAKEIFLAQVKANRSYAKNLKSDDLASVFIDHYVDNAVAADIDVYFDFSEKVIEDLTLEDLNAYVRKNYSRSNELIEMSGPEVEFPSKDEIRDILGAEYEIGAYVSDYEKKDLIVDDLTPGAIVKETILSKGIVKWELNNGTNVYLKESELDENVIQLKAISLGGTSTLDDYNVSNHYAGMAARSGGYANMTKREHEAFRALNSIGYQLAISENQIEITGRSQTESFQQLLKDMYASIRMAKGDEKQFNISIDNIRSSKENKTPQGLFLDTLRSVVLNHPRDLRETIDQLDKVNFKEAFDIYQKMVANIGDLNVFIVGDFEIEKIKPTVLRYIGGMKMNNVNLKPVDRGRTVAKSCEISFKTNVKTPIVSYYLQRSRDEKLSYKESAAFATLQRVLSERYMKILREEMGGTYTVGVDATMNDAVMPWKNFQLVISFDTNADMYEEMRKTAKSILNNLIENGPTAEELANSNNTFKIKWETLQETNYQMIQYIENKYVHGEEKFVTDAYPEYVYSLTPKMCKKHWRRMFKKFEEVEITMIGE